MDLLTCLPVEVLSQVCQLLDPRSLARLQQCSVTWARVGQNTAMWRRLARASNTIQPYPFITEMLDYVEKKKIRDRRAYKIILGSQRILENLVDLYVEQAVPATRAEIRAGPIEMMEDLLKESIQNLKSFNTRHSMVKEAEYLDLEQRVPGHGLLLCKVFNIFDLDVTKGIEEVGSIIEKLGFVRVYNLTSGLEVVCLDG